jgi:hypothetical protein
MKLAQDYRADKVLRIIFKLMKITKSKLIINMSSRMKTMQMELTLNNLMMIVMRVINYNRTNKELTADKLMREWIVKEVKDSKVGEIIMRVSNNKDLIVVKQIKELKVGKTKNNWMNNRDNKVGKANKRVYKNSIGYKLKKITSNIKDFQADKSLRD